MKKPAARRQSRNDARPAPFRERVYQAIRSVPPGRVASYGGIAAVIGQPRAARAVGTSLCTLPDDADVPWWRIINRNGEISIKCTMHGPALQRALLEREGVRFDASGRVDFERFGWDGSGVPAGVREDVEDSQRAGSTTERPASRIRHQHEPGATASPGQRGPSKVRTKRARP